MHNSPNRGVNYQIFQNKGNYSVIIIYGSKGVWLIVYQGVGVVMQLMV